jgi:hypothetical protein
MMECFYDNHTNASPRFGLPEIKSCAEKTKFRNSTQISYKNLCGKDKIAQPPGCPRRVKSGYIVLHSTVVASLVSPTRPLRTRAQSTVGPTCLELLYHSPRAGHPAYSRVSDLRLLRLSSVGVKHAVSGKFVGKAAPWLTMLPRLLTSEVLPTFTLVLVATPPRRGRAGT